MHVLLVLLWPNSVSVLFTECGGVLDAPMGEISSPNYPQNYDHNDACAWQIVAPEGTQIVVSCNVVSWRSRCPDGRDLQPQLPTEL